MENPPKCCDVPMCEKMCVPTRLFDNSNITCMKCDKFICTDCSTQIWTGEWNGKQFYKPKMIFSGVMHQVFRCPFCRASFDKMEQMKGKTSGKDSREKQRELEQEDKDAGRPVRRWAFCWNEEEEEWLGWER